MLPFFLASSSLARRAGMQRLGIPFEVHSPDIDETPQPAEPPQDMVRRLAERKAYVVKQQRGLQRGIVIAGDQVGVLDTGSGEQAVLGKPLSYECAVKQLEACSGRWVHFYHGVCVLNVASDRHCLLQEVTQVHYRVLTQAHIHAYLHQVQPYHCAGSLMAEDAGIFLLQSVRTQDPNALSALPLIQITSALYDLGVDIWALRQQWSDQCVTSSQ